MLLVLAAGCTDADIRLPADGGGGRDGGAMDSTVADANVPPDAPTPDAPTPIDSGMDAGAVDAFVPEVDAGPPPAPGELVITEIMVASDVVPDDFGEWVEVFNPSATTAFDLWGCILSDEGNLHIVASSVPIPPGGRVALARSDAPGFSEDYAYTDVKFSNDADTVTLSCAGSVVDSVAYDIAWPFSNGASLSLDPDFANATDNDMVTSWCGGMTPYNSGMGEVDLGTPGDPNPECP